MQNTVLGISFGHHESSVFIVNPNDASKNLFIAEEWVSRVKGDSRFPSFSLNFIKENYSELFESISTIVHFQRPLRNFLGAGLGWAPLSANHAKLKFRQFHSTDIFVEKNIKNFFKKRIQILYCDHHYSHVLNNVAFLPKLSENLNRMHVIFDGYGDGKSGGVYIEKLENQEYKLKQVEEFSLDESLGILYSAITEWAGFTPNEDEYKVMALASFGSEKYVKDAMKICYYDKLLKKIKIDKEYFNYERYDQKSYNSKFTEVFGFPDVEVLDPGLLWNSNLCNVIFAFQRALEECVFDVIDASLSRHLAINVRYQIVCGGGVLHNSVLVGRLLARYGGDLFVPPCPGDLGSSIGAANFGLLCQKLSPLNSLSPYLGPPAEDLARFDNLFEKIESLENNALSVAINHIKNGDTLAVYSGQLEVGPRALGARSLICDGSSKIAVAKLNEKRKRREPFRPVAPICNEDFFKQISSMVNSNSRVLNWMGAVVKVDDVNYQEACIHHDRTIRVQTIPTAELDFRIPELEFYKKILSSGINFLGNTSFNISGDPMVFRAEDVYVNLYRLGIDYVYNYGNFYKIKNVYD